MPPGDTNPLIFTTKHEKRSSGIGGKSNRGISRASA